MAIYALARGFAGCDMLITIGAVMAIFPLFYAMLADDFRRTLAHVLNNQLGFMVVAIGIGTPLAMDGAAGQAFVHVLYKGLLFMAMGAVLFSTGTCRQSQVGGLARRMPLTCIFCLVGALSVMPLNCSFVTKGLILEAAAEAHLDTIWLLLLAGSVGAFLAAGIRVPYYAFFHGDATHDAKEAPQNMLVAMGASAVLCLAIGVAPGLFYQLLPHGEAENPYTLSHVIHQLQLLVFSCAVFALFARFAPLRVASVLLDVDWIYRRPLPALIGLLRGRFASLGQTVSRAATTKWERVWEATRQQSGESGILGRSVSTNAMAFAAIVLLGIYLLLDY
jgi:multicomponent Na+:H+ antiporter subunit D